MKYLAVLGYDCGCSYDANYGFIKDIRFSAKDKRGLEKRVEKLKERKARSNEDAECGKTTPIECKVFDENFSLVYSWKRKK